MRKLYDKNKPSTSMPGQQNVGGKIRKTLLGLLGVLIIGCCNAQLSVTANSSASDLAQSLAGTGVAISNASRSGDAQGACLFTYTGSSLGISGGVIISNGKVANLAQPANTFSSGSFSGNGDAQLQTLTGGYIYDKSVLEFDIVPQGNVLSFNYIFASEEYPEWVCSQFNDVFGFFISGPKPSGGTYASQNIAKIPGTNLPVAINTINPGMSGLYGTAANCQSLAYSSQFRSNLTPAVNQEIVYDGMTKVLTAIITVIPCQTYHLKLAVADVGDRIFDSGVLLQANSITSIPVAIASSTQLDYAGYNSAYEGCVAGKFTFSIPSPQPVDVLARIQVGGTATNGVDYPTIPSTITIPAGQTSVVINVLPTQDNITEQPETITIEATDVCSGTTISTATMTLLDDVQPTITSSAATLCQGQTAQLAATGGVSYTWIPSAGLSNAAIASPIATPTTNTTYTANISWGSCNKTLSTSITVGGPVVTFTGSPSLISCNGSAVQVTANTSGNCTYQWSTGATTSIITASASGNYTVTVSDNSSCHSTATASVVVSNLALSATTANAQCGVSDGEINLTVTGGGNNTYTWSNGASTEDISNLIGGNYLVTVTNTSGCTATQSFSISQANSTMAATASSSNIQCNGASNGNVSLNISGGTAPFTYNWSNGRTTRDVAGLAAGTYSVTITDASGCALTKSVNLNEPQTIAISAGKTDATCAGSNNGLINLTVSGGNSTYTYGWNDGNNNKNRGNLAAGNYTVTVTDGNGCSASQAIAIAQPAAMALNLSVSATGCVGSTGSATVSASNGASPLSYNWSANNANASSITGLGAGNVTVTVTDANGCTAKSSKQLTVSGTTNADFTYTGNTCQGGGAVNFAHSGSTGVSAHTWSFGANTANAAYEFTAAGAQTVTHIVTEGNCADTVVKTVTIYNKPVITPTVNNATCNGGNNGSISLSVNSGTAPFNYAWNGGVTTQNRTNLSQGSYSATITDSHNCSATFSTQIIEASSIVLSETHTNATCFGKQDGSIQVSAAGGQAPYNYNWGSGVTSSSRTALTAGSYSVTVTDANNCSSVKAATITQPVQIQPSVTKTDLTCNSLNNGAININTNGGAGNFTYNWNNGRTGAAINNLAAGNYNVVIRDVNGCTTTASAEIKEPAQLTVASNTVNLACNGQNDGSIALSVNGGTPGYNYVWSNNAATANINQLTAGQYSVTVTDAKGCQKVIAGINITQPSALSVSSIVTDESCNQPNSGMVDATVTGGTAPYQYRWSNNATAQDLQYIAGGTYQLTVTDAKGCSGKTSADVAAASQLKLNAEVSHAACENATGAINLAIESGDAPFTYSWSNGQTTRSLAAVAAGTYTVTITDAGNCKLDTTLTVENTNSFEVHATSTGGINLGENAELKVTTTGVGEVKYSWTPALGASCNSCAETVVRPTTSTTYTVVAVDGNGCMSHDTVSIEVNDKTNIFLPNAFTPNGDGTNDYLQLYGDLSTIKFVQLLVFDRWGEKVFETGDGDFKWDGTYKGELLPPFSYIYVMKVVQLDGSTSRTFKGSVALLK